MTSGLDAPKRCRRSALLCLAVLGWASSVHADCVIEQTPATVHVGELGVFETRGAAMGNKLAERPAQVSITCPKGAAYTLRATAQPDEALVGDVVNMTHAESGKALRMAVVLESFSGARIERRFSALPMARYAAVGTGLPQMVSLRLEPAESPTQRRLDRRTAPPAGLYRAAFRLEVQLKTGP